MAADSALRYRGVTFPDRPAPPAPHSPMSARTNAAFTALLAAALFGATTPLAKTLLGSLTPFMVAGLFYLG